MKSEERGSWASRPGFILAATGSAVGLGNIWGFPTQAGQGGGAVFVLVYLLSVIFICAPIVLAETLLGRHAQLGPAGAVARIAPRTPWWLIGLLSVAAGTFILSFYSVIAGWTIQYLWFAATGQLAADAASSGEMFGRISGSGLRNVLFTGVFLALTAWCVNRGIRKGIESSVRWMMPALLVLLVVLAIRAVTLPGAAEGLSYYLSPDFSKILDPGVIRAAVGQAFFSLSLGMGALITYGSYMHRSHSVAPAAAAIVAVDTGVALLAGFIIFPAGFSIAAGFDPTAAGPGLIFVVLPQLFSTLGGGLVFGAAFFLLLSVAAFTSTISLLEVPTAHAIDRWNWTRRKAVVLITAFTFVCAIPSALSQGAAGFFSDIPAIGTDFLSLMVLLWNDNALPIGGFFIAVFVGWKWGGGVAEMERDGSRLISPRLWSFLIRYVSPLAILAIVVANLVSL